MSQENLNIEFKPGLDDYQKGLAESVARCMGILDKFGGGRLAYSVLIGGMSPESVMFSSNFKRSTDLGAWLHELADYVKQIPDSMNEAHTIEKDKEVD